MLLTVFRFIFCNQKYMQEIQDVLAALRKGENILDWEDIESFCSLFEAFRSDVLHTQFHLDTSQYDFQPHMIDFMQTCTYLDSYTDQFAYCKSMEEVERKEEILSHLEHLLQILPSVETFSLWVAAIRRK